MTLLRDCNSISHGVRPPKPKPLILMYHRISDDPVDPWGLAVTPTRFSEQLDLLCRTREPMPLAEFVRQLMAGTLRPNAVAVTFDDGYADNLVAAKPCLTAADVPATVFIATGYLDYPGEFWWDELARLILLEDAPESLEISVSGSVMRFELGAEPPSHGTRTWFASSAPQTRRQAVYLAILNILRRLKAQERQILMFELRSAVGGVPRAGFGRPMTSQEAWKLVADRLITVGAHSVTHPMLPELGAAVCHREIAESKAICEALIGQNVTAFAYPYGEFDANVRAAVRLNGFTCGFCAMEAPVTAASDIFALPRMQVFDWDGDALERALRSVSEGDHPISAPSTRLRIICARMMAQIGAWACRSRAT
jgi:peptidoglycan/xylan/chitin deacetylase (PgdA/CDA1 family)